MKDGTCNASSIEKHVGKVVKDLQNREVILDKIRSLKHLKDDLLHILDLIPTGIMLVNEQLEVLISNRYAADVLSDKDGLSLANSRISVAQAHVMRELKSALLQATVSDEPKSSVLSVGRPSGAQSFMVLLVPIRTNLSAVFVADPGRKPQVQRSLIADLFGLTKMESAVAASVAQGQRLNEVAENLKISLHTARSHLKHVFSKTGTDRQLELANQIGALLGKVWLEEEEKKSNKSSSRFNKKTDTNGERQLA